jgi:lipocalin-like protein
VNSTVSRKYMLSGLAGFGALVASAQPVAASASGGVTGAWKLKSFDMLLEHGLKQPRYGAHPVGYLIYTPSGRVSATLQAAHRAALTPPTGAASEPHCSESVTTFLAYAGTYEIRGDRVFHKLETCVFTNLVGTTLERQFVLNGDTLTIKTVPPYIWGNQSVLVWRRA